MKEGFGKTIHVAGLAVYGAIQKDHSKAIPAMIELAQSLVDVIGMNCSHPPQVADYEPGEDGVSPGFIVTQPIYESFLSLDVWPPLNALYVHVVSCKEFELEPIVKLLNDRHYVVKDFLHGGLQI